MKRVYSLALLLLVVFKCNAQFFQEDFANENINNPNPAVNSWTTDQVSWTCGSSFVISPNGNWQCGNDSNYTQGTLIYPGIANGAAIGDINCAGDWLQMYLTSPRINCSGQSQVYLTFVNLRAICNSDFSINVFDSLSSVSFPLINSTTANLATFDTIDISAFAANKSNIAVEFKISYFGPAGGSGVNEYDTWIVDDVSLYNPLCNINNEVKVNGTYDSTKMQYTFCAGDSIKLFLTQPQSAQTFQWYFNGNAIGGAIDSVYFASDSGLYSCKITDTCGYVFTKDIYAMTIYITPPAISCTGDLLYCAPITIKTIYAGLPTDPYTYQWYNNGVLIPNQNNYWMDCTQLTPYYAIVTTACGSYSTDTVTITQGATPTAIVTPAYPFPTCYPTPFTLNAFDSAGYSFQWQMGNVDIAGQTNNFITTVCGQSTYFTCVVTDVSGCTAVSSNIFANVNFGYTSVITAQGPTSICLGDSLTLTANQGTTNTYQWLHNNAIIPLATQSNYMASQAGTYTAYITNNTCTKLSNTIHVYVPCINSGSVPLPDARSSAISEQNIAEKIQLNTLVENNLSITSTDNIICINIFNGLGKLLVSEKTNSNSYTLNTSGLRAGLYFIAIQTSSGITKSKFVVSYPNR